MFVEVHILVYMFSVMVVLQRYSLDGRRVYSLVNANIEDMRRECWVLYLLLQNSIFLVLKKIIVVRIDFVTANSYVNIVQINQYY